jgi:hypothetical protein
VVELEIVNVNFETTGRDVFDVVEGQRREEISKMVDECVEKLKIKKWELKSLYLTEKKTYE